MVINDLAHVIPEGLAHKALRLPTVKHQSVMKESDLTPQPAAAEVVQKKILALRVDPETPESFMLRPKRRRWVNENWTRWVKSQVCVCCNKQADDPHHLIGHGQGGMGTKAHDLFVLPLCRAHHDELHADTVAFEQKYGSQLELIFRFWIVRWQSAYWRKWRRKMINPSEVGKSGEMVRLRTLESIWIQESCACGAAGHILAAVAVATCLISYWRQGR